jgi:hypothetical protein
MCMAVMFKVELTGAALLYRAASGDQESEVKRNVMQHFQPLSPNTFGALPRSPQAGENARTG